MICDGVCMRNMHRFLDGVDLFLDGTGWAVTSWLQ
jgi:hypothetical protein